MTTSHRLFTTIIVPQPAPETAPEVSYAPTVRGRAWWRAWKAAHPERASELEEWAREAVDRALAAKYGPNGGAA